MDTQVIIYLEDPKSQLMQVDYQSWKGYWRLLGWQIQGEATELPLMPKVRRPGIQAGLL